MTTPSTSLPYREPPLPPPFPLVDVHVHVGPSDTGELYYPTLAGDEYLGLMQAARVERAFAFAPLRAGGYREANEALVAWAATTDGRVRAFARLGGRQQPVSRPAPWLLRRWMRRALAERRRPADLATPADLDRFAGVKLLPHLDGLPGADFFDEIARRRLPVLVHGGVYVEPAWIEQAILPRVAGPLIIAHLGSFPAEEPLLREAVELAARRANVYLDTSGVWTAGFLRYAARRIPEKLLFGSDAPLTHPSAAWHHVASVVEDDGALERIGRHNAAEVFDLP